MIFTYESYIVPYVRMTRKGKFVDPRAQRYLASKAEMAYSFKTAMGREEFDMIPARTPFEVSITLMHTAGHKADLDNILKAILDAGNGIIYPDDRWCNEIHIVRHGREFDSMVLKVEVMG